MMMKDGQSVMRIPKMTSAALLLIAFITLLGSRSCWALENSSTHSGYVPGSQKCRLCTESPYRLEASPQFVVPGEETAVFVSRVAEAEDDNCCSCTGSSSSRLSVQLVLKSSRDKSSNTLFRTKWEVNTLDLVEDSSRYQPNFGIFDEESDADAAALRRRQKLRNVTVFAVPFRIPLEVTLTRQFQSGVAVKSAKRSNAAAVGLQATLSVTCPQVVQTETQATNEEQKGLDIPFQVKSPLRQIVIFTDKTSYKLGDSVTIFYQPLDEDTKALYMSRIAVALFDPQNLNIHTWTIGGTETKDAKVFKSLEYALGQRASVGTWRVCAE